MSSLHVLVIVCAFGLVLAFSGEYVPKSFYTIDEHGHKSDVIYLRKTFAPRVRRGAGYSGAASYGGSAGLDGSGIAQAVESGLDNTFQKLRGLANEVAAHAGAAGGPGGAGGASFSGSYGGSGVGGHGPGPVLYSRFADDAAGSERELVTGGQGTVHASASASGPNGGVSFSSSSVDSNGNVQYKTQARKF